MSNKNLYKNEFGIVHPGATLLETLETLGMTQSELALRISRPEKTISEIINGIAMITPDTAIQFERALGVSASFWNSLEKNYQLELANAKARLQLKSEQPNLIKFPYKEIASLGWVKKSKDIIERIENLLSFYGVSSLSSISVVQEVAFRKAKAVSFSPEALATWLRKGELDSYEIETKPFNKDGLINSLSELRSLTRGNIAETSKKAQQICAENGVVLVFVQYLPKSNVNGATRWINPSKSLVQLSLRGHFNDRFWFTFFHELGHVLYGGKREKFIDIDNQEITDEEKLADKFAREQLIPTEKLNAFLEGNEISINSIKKFADEIGIHPGIVVGRLQYEQILDYKSFNGLKEKYFIKKEE